MYTFGHALLLPCKLLTCVSPGLTFDLYTTMYTSVYHHVMPCIPPCMLLTCIPLHFISTMYTSVVDITRSYFWLVYHHAPGQSSFPISLGKSSLFHVVINPHINLFILIFREGFTSRVFGVWGSHLISVPSSCHFEKVSLVFGVWGLVFGVWCLRQSSCLLSSRTNRSHRSSQTRFRQLATSTSDLFQSLTHN